MTFLIQTTVYLTVTAVFLLLFKQVFKSKLSAKWQVYIWGLLLIRFLVPSLPQSEFSIFNSLTIPSEYISHNQSEYTGDINLNEIHTESVQNETLTKSIADEDKMIKTVSAEEIVKIIWFCGSLALFLYFVTVYLICLKKINMKNKATDVETNNLLNECKRMIGIKRNVGILSGGSPMLAGIIKPKIILPADYSFSEKKILLYTNFVTLKIMIF